MKRGACIVLAAALAVGLAACDNPITGGDGGSAQPPGQVTPSAGEPGQTGGPGQPGEAPAAEPGEQPAQPGGVLASREIQDDGANLQVDITGLQRQGQAVTLSWRITVLDGDEDATWYVRDSMGSGNLDYTVSGVVLVDPINAQRYLVARSGGEDGPCVCSDSTNFTMDAGDASEFYATYGAPPPDVTAINVEFPRFGAFTDVPLS